MADTDPLIPSVKYATFDTLGDGVQTSWEFNFAGGYISRDHVKAFTQDLVTGELRIVAPLTFTGPNTVTITPAVPEGIRLVIYRDTPKESPIVDYSEGSIINERNMDVSNLQAVFIAAELADRVVADYDFSNALLYATITATTAITVANGIDGKAQAALNAASAAEQSSAAAVSAVAGVGNSLNAYKSQLASAVGSTLVGYSNYGVARSVASMLDQLQAGWVNASDPRFLGGIHGPTPMKALQAAHDWASATYTHSTVYWSPSGDDVTAAGPDGLVWDTTRVGLECTQYINANLFTGSVFMDFVQTFPVSGSRPAYNSVHVIRNMIVDGPGYLVGSTCFRIRDLSASATIAGVTIEGGAAWGWNRIMHLGRGAFFTHVSNFDFGTSNGFGGGTEEHVFIEGGVANAGERNIFDNCRWSGRGTYFVVAQGPSSTFVRGGSMNYNVGRMLYLVGGSIHFSDMHIESNGDIAPWFEILGDNSYCTVSNCQFVVSAAKTQFSLFNTTVPGSGLVIRDCHVGYRDGMSVPLVSGTGAVSASGIKSYWTSGGIHIGPGMNLLNDGGFGKGGAWAREWTVGAVPPVLANDGFSFPGDSPWSLKFTSTTNAIVHDDEITPGKMTSIRFYATRTAVTTGTFLCAVEFLDAGGVPLTTASGTVYALTGSAAGAFYQVGWPFPAPAGAHKVRWAFSFFGETSPTARVDLDLVEINIQ